MREVSTYLSIYICVCVCVCEVSEYVYMKLVRGMKRKGEEKRSKTYVSDSPVTTHAPLNPRRTLETAESILFFTGE